MFWRGPYYTTRCTGVRSRTKSWTSEFPEIWNRGHTYSNSYILLIQTQASQSRSFRSIFCNYWICQIWWLPNFWVLVNLWPRGEGKVRKSGNVIIKVKSHREVFIETPKFVVLRGFHKSRNESPLRGTRSPNLGGFHNLNLIWGSCVSVNRLVCCGNIWKETYKLLGTKLVLCMCTPFTAGCCRIYFQNLPKKACGHDGAVVNAFNTSTSSSCLFCFTKCKISLQLFGVTRAVVTEIDFLVYFVIACTYHCIAPTLSAFLHKFVLFLPTATITKKKQTLFTTIQVFACEYSSLHLWGIRVYFFKNRNESSIPYAIIHLLWRCLWHTDIFKTFVLTIQLCAL